jgi:DNA-binding transcriptional LysR family regulator
MAALTRKGGPQRNFRSRRRFGKTEPHAGRISREVMEHRYKQNRFQQLRGFCYAAASGSISKAAGRMFLSQPAVSQQIQSLERELGVTLFIRGKGKMQLTHDGELLFQMAQSLIEELEHLDQRFRRRRFEIDEGHLEIAAGMSTILYLLPKYVEAFRRAHPKIELRLHQVTGLEGLEQLRSGLVDFAVGPLYQVPADIEFHPIVTYDPVVIACVGHPLCRKGKLTLLEISRHPLILPPRNLSTWPMVDSTFKKHGLSYQVAMEVGGWEAIKKYVALGMGISIIIQIGITGEEKLEVMPAAEFFPRRTYGVVTRKGRVLTPQAKRFVSLLLSSPMKNGNFPAATPAVSMSA